MTTGLVTHPLYLQHDTGPTHPESPERLTAILRHLDDVEVDRIVPQHRPDVADWITQVHAPAYYDALKAAVPRQGFVRLDPDTPYSPGSFAAAEMAVCGLLTAVDHVMDGTLQNAFCALRPPGHHAEAARAMGFCLFNSVAIGARYLQKRHGLGRILIVDWDVHHGNGTQHLFEASPDVFYFSTHQYPFYPGTGAASERGRGLGEGTTLNCPLPEGSGDREILSRFEKALIPAMSHFKPEFILISAGFDAHREDPLAGLRVSDDGFAEMTRIVQALARTHCGGRLVSCLEGGYNLEALARSVRRHLGVLTGG